MALENRLHSWGAGSVDARVAGADHAGYQEASAAEVIGPLTSPDNAYRLEDSNAIPCLQGQQIHTHSVLERNITASPTLAQISRLAGLMRESSENRPSNDVKKGRPGSLNMSAAGAPSGSLQRVQQPREMSFTCDLPGLAETRIRVTMDPKSGVLVELVPEQAGRSLDQTVGRAALAQLAAGLAKNLDNLSVRCQACCFFWSDSADNRDDEDSPDTRGTD